MTTCRVLVVSKGHAYDHNSFLAMFEEDPEIETTPVEQPAAQVILQPGNVDRYDAILFYDMSGIPDIGLLHDDANDTGTPPPSYVAAIENLLESGRGIVMLNHATVYWPDGRCGGSSMARLSC